MSRTTVPPLPARTPAFGLVAALGGEAAIQQFTAANPPLDPGPDRWLDGFDFVPFDCSGNGAPRPNPCVAELNADPEPLPATVSNDPFILWEGVECSTLSNLPEELNERARAKLLTTTSFQLEREFWRGTQAQAFTLPNVYLANATGLTDVTPVSGDAPLVYALGLMQNQIAACAAGNRAFIYVTPMTATLLLSASAIQYVNGQLLDAMGNLVVPGAGFDGSAPDGTIDTTYDTAWMYATTVPAIRMTPVEIVEPDVAVRLQLTNNLDQAIAMRYASVYTDECCRVGVNVNLCETCCSPTVPD